MQQRPGEQTEEWTAESEVLKASVSQESCMFGGSKESPTEKSGSKQASTTSSKRRSGGAGNGLAMYFAWRRTVIHMPHWHGLHLGRVAEADLWVPWDGQSSQRWRKQGRPGMNSGGLPETGLPVELTFLTPYAPLGAKRIGSVIWNNHILKMQCCIPCITTRWTDSNETKDSEND